MTMYGLVFGQNPAAEFLLGILDLTKADVGRFRDCWVTKDGRIAVYTRNGGGNRECWDEDGPKADTAGCGCVGCTMRYELPQHPMYLGDEDDEFDCTYATIYFRVPEEAKRLVAGLGEDRDPDEEWMKALQALKDGKRPDVVSALAPAIHRIVESLGAKKP